MALKIGERHQWGAAKNIDAILKSGFLNPLTGIRYFGVVKYLKLILQTPTGQVCVAPERSFFEGKRIIYAKSPKISNSSNRKARLSTSEKQALIVCYLNALERASQLGCKCIHVPLICETKQPLLLCEFFQVAKLTCLHFLLEHDVDIILTYPRVVEHKRQELQEDPFADIAKYIEKKS